jgi:hypothetical protein
MRCLKFLCFAVQFFAAASAFAAQQLTVEEIAAQRAGIISVLAQQLAQDEFLIQQLKSQVPSPTKKSPPSQSNAK